MCRRSHEYEVRGQKVTVRELTEEALAAVHRSERDGRIDPVSLLYASTGLKYPDLIGLTDEEFWTMAENAMVINRIPGWEGLAADNPPRPAIPDLSRSVKIGNWEQPYRSEVDDTREDSND